jgi:hypothetical protein
LAPRAPARLKPGEGRRFAWTVGTAFLVLAVVVFWRGYAWASVIFTVFGGTLWLAGLALPERLGPLQAAWMKLAHAISRVTSPIVLAVVFFLVITPIGLVMRLGGRNPIRHQPVDSSFWFRRTGDASDLRRQF